MRGLAEMDLLLQSFLSRFHSIPARQRTSSEVTFAQMRVLWALHRFGEGPLNAVARRIGVSSATGTSLVNRLVARNYVRRVRSTIDGREVVLSLRPEGRRVLAAFALRRRARLRKLLGALAPSERGRLKGALETLSGLAGRWEEPS